MIKETDMFYIFILKTDSNYSQEVNKMNKLDICNDHSFITIYLKLFAVLKGFKYSNFDLNVRPVVQFRRWFNEHSKVQLTSRGNICTILGLYVMNAG